ncbi:hypothetical protein HZC33_01075 [Candidatus Wolfebacteria bacterium]|nr:hypothetical protein [Candidatus Wolfebacteria bacterium]
MNNDFFFVMAFAERRIGPSLNRKGQGLLVLMIAGLTRAPTMHSPLPAQESMITAAVVWVVLAIWSVLILAMSSVAVAVAKDGATNNKQLAMIPENKNRKNRMGSSFLKMLLESVNALKTKTSFPKSS